MPCVNFPVLSNGSDWLRRQQDSTKYNNMKLKEAQQQQQQPNRPHQLNN